MVMLDHGLEWIYGAVARRLLDDVWVVYEWGLVDLVCANPTHSS